MAGLEQEEDLLSESDIFDLSKKRGRKKRKPIQSAKTHSSSEIPSSADVSTAILPVGNESLQSSRITTTSISSTLSSSSTAVIAQQMSHRDTTLASAERIGAYNNTDTSNNDDNINNNNRNNNIANNNNNNIADNVDDEDISADALADMEDFEFGNFTSDQAFTDEFVQQAQLQMHQNSVQILFDDLEALTKKNTKQAYYW